MTVKWWSRRLNPRASAGPVRTCVGCGRKAPADQLIRIAATVGGDLEPSRTASGRGAWICRKWQPCLVAARSRNSLARTLRTAVSAAAIDRLMAELATYEIEHRAGVCEDGGLPAGGFA